VLELDLQPVLLEVGLPLLRHALQVADVRLVPHRLHLGRVHLLEALQRVRGLAQALLEGVGPLLVRRTLTGPLR
jgi:hypothetical protein